MGDECTPAWRARKRAKHMPMMPISSTLMKKQREYGARKLKPRVSMLGSTTAFVPHVRDGGSLDISRAAGE